MGTNNSTASLHLLFYVVGTLPSVERLFLLWESGHEDNQDQTKNPHGPTFHGYSQVFRQTAIVGFALRDSRDSKHIITRVSRTENAVSEHKYLVTHQWDTFLVILENYTAGNPSVHYYTYRTHSSTL